MSIQCTENDFKCDNNEILVNLNATTDYNFLNCLFTSINDLMYNAHVLSFLFRFIYNVKNPSQKRVGYLTATELAQREIFFLKKVQEDQFSSELKCLSKSENEVPLPPLQ